MDIDKMLIEFIKTRNKDIRNELIVKYIPFVKKIARKIYEEINKTVEYNDLFEWGIFGLIDSINRFIPNTGAKFGTYAYYRIRGCIFTNIRYNDFLPDSIHRKIKKAKKIYEEKHKCGETITMLEAAKKVYKKDSSAKKLLYYINLASFTILTTENNLSSPSAEESSVDNESKKELIEAINNLEDTERKVILLRYFHNKKITEIHKIMEISYQHALYLHSKAIKKLNKTLKKQIIF